MEIGKELENARLDAGYETRGQFVEQLKGKLTQEGLRKIELGERIPRFETIRLLGEALGLPQKKIIELETLALEKGVERVAHRTTADTPVAVAVEGRPLKVVRPTGKRTEQFVRGLVDSLSEIIEKYGLMEEDLSHFKRHARYQILKHLR